MNPLSMLGKKDETEPKPTQQLSLGQIVLSLISFFTDSRLARYINQKLPVLSSPSALKAKV